MKYDPENEVWYDHTPEEWAAMFGSSFWTVTGSLACHYAPAPGPEQPQPQPQPDGVLRPERNKP